MNPFCPELQLPWTVRSIEARSLQRVVVHAEFSVGVPPPTPLGRHVADITSYPKTYDVIAEAEFVFIECLSVTMRDEMLVSLTEKIDGGEGETFVRFLASPQIEAARLGRPDGCSIFHYRILTQNEIVDVVCCKVPEVLVRHMREPESPIAGK